MNTNNKILYTYEKVKKDSEGYLRKTKDWNIILAEEIAKKENIDLSPDHWKVIIFIRKFYFKFNITPSMRMLIKSIKKKWENLKVTVFIYLNFFLKDLLNKQAKLLEYLNQLNAYKLKYLKKTSADIKKLNITITIIE